MHRFYSSEPLSLPLVRLDGDEAHHLLHVLRAAIGQEVALFDGTGWEATARIVQIDRNRAELEIVERRQCPPDTPVPIVLGTAVPKGERFDWLVEKATELGISQLVPLNTKHSVVTPGPGKLDRLRRTIIPATKQCGRHRLMELGDPISWPLFVEQQFTGCDALVAHPGGEPLAQVVLSMTRPIVLAVGPEGGLTDEEAALARKHGARVVNLGPRLLRVETAAVAMAAHCGLR